MHSQLFLSPTHTHIFLILFPSYTDPLCHHIPVISLFCIQAHKHHPSHLFTVTLCFSLSLFLLPSLALGQSVLFLGNTPPLHPQSPTNLHTLQQQQIERERETHSPPVCLCVGGYMIAFKYVCSIYRCVCVCVVASTCGCACVLKQMLLGLTCVE